MDFTDAPKHPAAFAGYILIVRCEHFERNWNDGLLINRPGPVICALGFYSTAASDSLENRNFLLSDLTVTS